MTDPSDGRDEAAETRRPSPGAQAASRARRIGGRPLPGPRPSESTGDEPPPRRPSPKPSPKPQADEPVALTKPARRAAAVSTPDADTDPAPMGLRLVARLADGLIIGLVIATLYAAVNVSLIAARAGGSGVVVGSSLAVIPAALIIGLAYESIMVGRTGATYGKRLAGISVVDRDTRQPIGVGRALLRAVVLVVTGEVIFLGYLSPFFNRRRRGWHDLAARDEVLRGAARGAEASALSTAQRTRWIPAIVLGVLAYLIIGGTNAYALTALKHKPVPGGPNQSLRQQVLAAAKTCTARILSYDYRSLDASEKAGQACSTGQLKSDYTQLMETTVKQIAPQNNVVQVFQVENAGIGKVSPDGKQWVVLVFGQQQITSKTATAGPRLDISNAVVTLNQVNGQWLISNMTTTS